MGSVFLWTVGALTLLGGSARTLSLPSLTDIMTDTMMDTIMTCVKNGTFNNTDLDKDARLPAPHDVNFTLYTRSGRFPIDDRFQYTYFNRTLPTKVLIHGFVSSPDIFNGTKDAYLREGDVNVILVDWSLPSRCWHDSDVVAVLALCYGSAARRHAPTVGDLLGKQLLQMQPTDAHLIGHSLGAHVAGVAAKRYTVRRVTGLDPAAPLIDIGLRELRLDRNDAEFVDVIHTSVGVFGWTNALGHADFFPNEGKAPQPRCGVLKDLFKTCSHASAHVYFTTSIARANQTLFNATSCGQGLSFQRDRCADVLEKTDNSQTVMGEHVSRKARGLFYVKVDSERILKSMAPKKTNPSAMLTALFACWLGRLSSKWLP